jgi:putative selenium metabolism hydrolase
MFTKEREDALIRFCRELVTTPSLSGQEKEVAVKIQNYLKQLGFDEVKVDRYGSVIGHIKGNFPGETVLIDGHMDTVDIADRSRWTKDPYGGEIADGKIYGRGTTDMKGSLAAFVSAAGYLGQDTGKNFKGHIYVTCTVHEECFEGVAARAITKEIVPDFVIIGEASNLAIKRGQRGRAEIVVETIGKAAHSSHPQVGKNAVYEMTKVIEAVRQTKLNKQEVLGEGILELTDIISTPYPGASVVPDLCRVTYDRRTLAGETKESVLNQMQKIIDQLQETDPTLEARVAYAQGEEACWTGAKIGAERFFPAWLYDEQHELVQKAVSGLQSVGLNPKISHYAFCTNGSHFAGELKIPTIGFGPSQECLAHVIDEYIEIDQLLKSCRGFYGILQALLS